MAVCESLERALKESISYVLERFDGVEKLSDEQTSGVLNFIQLCKDVDLIDSHIRDKRTPCNLTAG